MAQSQSNPSRVVNVGTEGENEVQKSESAVEVVLRNVRLARPAREDVEERDVLLHLQRFRARVLVIRQELSCAARKIRLVAQAVRAVWVLVRRSWLERLVEGLARQAVAVFPRARCADDYSSPWVILRASRLGCIPHPLTGFPAKREARHCEVLDEKRQSHRKRRRNW